MSETLTRKQVEACDPDTIPGRIWKDTCLAAMRESDMRADDNITLCQEIDTLNAEIERLRGVLAAVGVNIRSIATDCDGAIENSRALEGEKSG